MPNDNEVRLKAGNEMPQRIEILVALRPKHAAEVERILSHTRWQAHVVSSIHDAVQALRSRPISVVLCEDALHDGRWLDLMRETEELYPRPQTIVLSARADSALWGEVLNCGGFDLIATPIDCQELYTVIPMAWRQGAGAAAKVAAEKKESLAQLVPVS